MISPNQPFSLSSLSLNQSQKLCSSSVIGASSAGSTPTIVGGTSAGSAAEEASIGEIEITASGDASAVVEGGGVEDVGDAEIGATKEEARGVDTGEREDFAEAEM